MYFKQSLLVIAAALSLTGAIAVPNDLKPRHGHSSGAQRNHKEPTLPVNGGPRELTAPPAGLKLKYIALGVGVQNYTCSTVSGTPVATGALAMLYDVTKLFPGQGPRSDSQAVWNNTPSFVNHNHKVPLNFDPSLPNRLPAADEGVSQTHPFTCSEPLVLKHSRRKQHLPFLGHHFFQDAVPNFVLADGAVHVMAKKLDGIPPPSIADSGKDGTGAVAWLQLGDAGGSVGATYVYRVLTVGGNPHGCSSGTGDDTVSYSAYYWFYG